jgi:hypothetical protein
MRITQTNVEQVKDYLDQVDEFKDDLSSACETWLEAQDNTEADPDETRDARETIEEHFDTFVGLAEAVVTLNDKWALYSPKRDTAFKAEITRLKVEVERLNDQLDHLKES